MRPSGFPSAAAWPHEQECPTAGGPPPGEADHSSHPDLKEWLASDADMVTGEDDRRSVPIGDLLTMDEVFGYTAGKPMLLLAVHDGTAHVSADTVSRGEELLSRLTEAMYLVRVEAPTWSPQTHAQAIALLHHATDELTKRHHQ